MTRFFQRTIAGGLVALLVLVTGCDLTSLNDNPNEPTSADPPKLLTNAQMGIATEYWQDYPGGFWVRYAQYWTTNQYTDADRYAYPDARPGALNNLFEDFYLALNDLEEIKRINRESPGLASANGPNANQIAIANIMQVWTLSLMTDMWGPIPLAEALKGQSSGNFSPAYTSGPQVYQAMIDSLTQASDNIQTDAPTLVSGDRVYSGNMSKWKKLANSLKLRIALRASGKGDGVPSGVDEATVEQWMTEALNAGVFESNDDSALLQHGSSAPYQNDFYVNRVVSGRRDWAAPQSILSVMNAQEDPRRSAYFTDADPNTSGDQFNGLPYGLRQGDAQTLFTSGNFSIPSDRVASTATAPCIIMLHDEVEFIKAEIAVRSDLNVNTDQAAQDHFEDAIRASLAYWDVTDESEQDGFINRVPTLTENNFRQVLGTQKWLAQYLQGIQGWSTWRRLDFTGVLTIPDGNPGQASFGKDIAVRMRYPTDEFTLNEENVTAAINNQLGGSGASEDTQGVLLWWDTEYVNPEGE
jgi:hypothetical protein